QFIFFTGTIEENRLSLILTNKEKMEAFAAHPINCSSISNLNVLDVHVVEGIPQSCFERITPEAFETLTDADKVRALHFEFLNQMQVAKIPASSLGNLQVQSVKAGDKLQDSTSYFKRAALHFKRNHMCSIIGNTHK